MEILKIFEFLKLCNSIIPDPYDGNPSKIESFIKSIILIQKITTPELNDILLEFIKSKLIGIAAEVISVTESNLSVEKIINTLNFKFKEINPEFILGQMLMLRANNNFVYFSEQLQKFSNELIAAYMTLGIPRKVATKITIVHTNKVCQSNSYYFVKMILKSSTFESTEELIAKFLLEMAIYEEENKINNNYDNYNYCLRKNRYFNRNVKYFGKNNGNIIENNNLTNNDIGKMNKKDTYEKKNNIEAKSTAKKNNENHEYVKMENNDNENYENLYDVKKPFKEKVIVEENKIVAKENEKKIAKKGKNDKVFEKIDKCNGKLKYEIRKIKKSKKEFCIIFLKELVKLILMIWITLNEIVNINDMKLPKMQKMRKSLKKNIKDNEKQFTENEQRFNDKFENEIYRKESPSENIPPDKFSLKFAKLIFKKKKSIKNIA